MERTLFQSLREYHEAFLTVKTFFIFREIRIQFRGTGKYQYHPAICCVPDSNVRKALRYLGLLDHARGNLDSLSQLIADEFCTKEYELYDLPLFFWYKEKGKYFTKGKYAGLCPTCGSPLVWRRAKRTGEIYKGCTNFPRCRYNTRSYQKS